MPIGILIRPVKRPQIAAFIILTVHPVRVPIVENDVDCLAVANAVVDSPADVAGFLLLCDIHVLVVVHYCGLHVGLTHRKHKLAS